MTAAGSRLQPSGSQDGARSCTFIVHTEYSMLDGAARLKDLFAACQRTDMPAIAITDHGNVYGAYDFWSKATAAGVKPIIGIEAYVAPEHRAVPAAGPLGEPGAEGRRRVRRRRLHPHDAARRDHRGHAQPVPALLLRLARGLLPQAADGPRTARRPRRGLIATTGCPSGEVQTRLRLGQYDEAVAAAAAYRDIFGPGNFFVEIMDHGLAIEQRTRDGLRRLARDLSLPFVVTNDSHYTTPGGRHPARGAAAPCRPAPPSPTRPVPVRGHGLLPQEPGGDAGGEHR